MITTYLYAGGGVIASLIFGLVMWFTYRAGKNAASINTTKSQIDAAQVVSTKAQAMAQAEADKPTTEQAVLDRLNEGSL